MNETMTKISSTTLSSSQSAVTFSNIPKTYSDLKVVISARNANNNYGGYQVRLNGLTTGSHRYLRAYNGTSLQTGTVSSMVDVAVLPISSDSANVFSTDTLYIPDYTSAHDKVFYLDSTRDITTVDSVVRMVTGYQTSTIPVTSLVITLDTDLFAAQSTFTLYGIKNSTKIFGNSTRATGGVITTDGSYIYHAFTSTSAFVPVQPLLVDALIVAGGGGGGGANAGGGGGAGGLVYKPFISVNPASYTITVGSGGTGAIPSSGGGSNGGDSVALGYTATGGGLAGWWLNSTSRNGSAGGCGGGAGEYGGAGTGGATTQATYSGAGYGNAGGTAAASGSVIATAGGGGAGAAGQSSPSTTVAGAGGVGLYYDDFGFATKTGEFINGHWYYAGGGGGSQYVSGPNLGLGGYGGGGRGGYGGVQNAVAGLAYTGGGGGGSGWNSSSDTTRINGGSGVVIIRYKA